MWTLVLSSLSVILHCSAFGIFGIGEIPVDIDSEVYSVNHSFAIVYTHTLMQAIFSLMCSYNTAVAGRFELFRI
jgi:hypothetical protein